MNHDTKEAINKLPKCRNCKTFLLYEQHRGQSRVPLKCSECGAIRPAAPKAWMNFVYFMWGLVVIAIILLFII